MHLSLTGIRKIGSFIDPEVGKWRAPLCDTGSGGLDLAGTGIS